MRKLKTLEDILAAFWAKVNKRGPMCAHLGTCCYEWVAGADDDGYGVFGFRGKSAKAHRVAWILFRGEIPKGKCVLHKCDNPSCIRPSHLFLGDQMDNRRDMLAKGRGRNYRKISSGMVTVIRREYIAGYDSGELAVRFRIPSGHISKLLTGRIFKDQDAELLSVIISQPLRKPKRAGQWNGRAKLFPVQIREIRASKETSGVLAQRFSVKPDTIRDIRKGVLWRSLL